MAKRRDRGGAKTRAHIAAVATKMFLEGGFDDVTIAEIAAAAGVSKVTVFAHFERKEDIFLDRLPEVIETIRNVIDTKPAGRGAIEALRQAAMELIAERHPLAGLAEGIEPFLQTLVGSPALIARLRAFELEIEHELARHLDASTDFSGDAPLAAALIVAAYRRVSVNMVRARLAGDALADVAVRYREQLDAAFDAVAYGVSADRPDNG